MLRLGREALRDVLGALPREDDAREADARVGELVIDARALERTWSRGDWGLLATRAPGSVVIVALEDATTAGHDHVHGAGAHARSVETLQALADVGLPSLVTTTITRSNARSSTAIARELTRLRSQAWCLTLARTEDAAAAPALLPSLGVTTPHVLRGAELAARAGVHVFFRGLPRCVLGPYARWAAPSTTIASGEPCDACSARAGCDGLAPRHRERFGSRELRALDGVVAAEPSPARVLVARAFAALDTSNESKTSAD